MTPNPQPTLPVPFWNTNLPPTLHTKDCPSYLTYAKQPENSKDRLILSTPDSAYTRQSWAEVQALIDTNRLDLFQRVPSDLRRYREYAEKIAREFGSVREFVMRERLGWGGLEGRGKRDKKEGVWFGDGDDYKILLNDWPYGIDPRIVHLVVWTKFEFPSDPVTGDLTAEARKAIEEFVGEEFGRRCGEGRVRWFRNWGSLKSVHAVEHFHVMLFDPDREFVREVTGGDVALADKVGKVSEM